MAAIALRATAPLPPVSAAGRLKTDMATAALSQSIASLGGLAEEI